ncbi:MAG: hypothetical protein A2Y17_00370 [Clostridiales bacterium GWF2_38_85]|nr:MAG: hypothetical protein A2Y17_00370 [Clostridiales bacterium GWF2_38_85]HBL83552.1 hypothetical protein [Clostridiales bacterium]
MSKYPQFTMSFSIGPTNKDRIDAFEIYHKAFKAKKLSESTPSNSDDIHIMMNIYGLDILIGPGKVTGTGFEGALSCEIRFDEEDDFHQAYDGISKDAQSHSIEGPYPWATLLGLVVDKFGIGWALYYNE